MVITKSISRFARNTLDCLKYIRLLKDKGIPVYFEKKNINTMDSKGEIMLTIMASLSQQESQSLSQNVKLGIQYRFQQGEVQVNHNRFLGYTKDENKHLVIDPKGAEVVKRIFREYLEGASMLQIGRGLEADDILTAAGKQKWRPDNARMESFFATLKKEKLYRMRTERYPMAYVKTVIFRYVMIYYNRQRIYTANPGGWPPMVFREQRQRVAA
jgi:hypothetical protein